MPKRKLSYQEKILRMGKHHKKSAGKHVIIMLSCCILFIIGHEIFFSTDKAKVNKTDDSVFTAAFVGDMMFGRHVKDVTDKYGYDHLFEKVSPIFEHADYASGNFENPILLENEDKYEDDKLDKNIHLSADDNAAKAMKKANFSVVNLANNHLMDFGQPGLEDTIDSLDDAELDHVGAGDLDEAIEVNYQKFDGLTVATLGYTDVVVEGFSALGYRPGVARATPDNIFPQIEDASEEADLVLVNIHWGTEYDKDPHPRQKELGQAMVEAGADVIIGHHQHILSEVENYRGEYNDGIIFYGLGNFIFDQGWTQTKDSAVVQYDLTEDGTGQFRIIPLRIRSSQPYVTNNKYYQTKIHSQLTRHQPDDNFRTDDGDLILEVDHTDILDALKKGDK